MKFTGEAPMDRTANQLQGQARLPQLRACGGTRGGECAGWAGTGNLCEEPREGNRGSRVNKSNSSINNYYLMIRVAIA